MTKKFWTELWFFLLFIMGGIVVMALLAIPLSMFVGNPGQGGIPADGPAYFHIVQWLQTIFVMFLPALCWCRWRMKEPLSVALAMNNKATWKPYALVVVLSLVALPFFDWLSDVCQNLPLPEAIRAYAENEYKMQEALVGKMLSIDGFGGWLEMILLMSVATAIAEELTFRGALLTIFLRYTKYNKHVVAILVGLIFALIHMEIFGIIPRWILGTAFVYLVYYTGSIWPSVLAHALNNLCALLEYKEIIG